MSVVAKFPWRERPAAIARGLEWYSTVKKAYPDYDLNAQPTFSWK